MMKPQTLADLSHFDLFRILDFVKANCDPKDKSVPFDQVNYADLYNFAATCKRHRRILWDWSQEMYERLEIELLQVHAYKKLTVKFNEIHSTLKGASKAKKHWYLDVFIRDMLGNQNIECIELRYTPRKYLKTHEEIFQKILRAIQANFHQEESMNPYPKIRSKVKEIIVNIAECEFFGLGQFRNISKLRLTARFAMLDLVEFCKNNQSLSSLELNSYLHSDHGKLTYIVNHCPKLKELKFMLNDNGLLRDAEYVKLANLDKLQQLEIRKPPNHITFEADMNVDKYYDCKRPRMDTGYEALIIPEGPKEENVPVRSLLAAIAGRKRQTLSRLILKFEIDDKLVQTIGKIQSLRLLECGIYDLGCIRHLAKLEKLTKLSLLNKGHLISVGVIELLTRHITVSTFDTQIGFSSRGTLSIISNDPNNFRDVDFALLLKMKNLKCLFVSSIMLRTVNHIWPSFLENGIEIKSNEVCLSFDIRSTCLCIIMDSDAKVKFPLPVVKNLRSFRMISLGEPRSPLLKSLETHYSTTLLEVYICLPYTIFECPTSEYLSEEDVAVLAHITSLRRVSCVLQKLKFVQPFAQLRELESLVVFSGHDPRKVEFGRWIFPILILCPKLEHFYITLKGLHLPPNRLPKNFFFHLDSALNRSRVGISHKLKFCLASSTDYKFTQKQIRQTENMKYCTVQTKYVENNHFFD
ncbi:uncharacterized protein LOC117893902 isoform X1 [Drosophila subobscura]|uniref:uncharacterized protein LOC117893902 isoform X1 n=1 Tax=Drosophila subobscura TaxID=7241 RepID=UPI00155A9CF4|nr:uncharacterized protein LOC117893902 isoform X1 [Drosophila subobscura]